MSRRDKRQEPEPVRRWIRILWILPLIGALGLGAGFALSKGREKTVEDASGVRAVSFAELSSFHYAASREKDAPDPFPAEIRALDGQKVTVTGYLVPLHFEAGKLESFFLTRGGFACCYADAPKVTDHIKVSMPPGQYAPVSNMVSVSGAFHVGEERGTGGWLEAVYQMTAESVTPEVARASAGWADYTLSGLAAVGVVLVMAAFAVNVLKPWLRARHIGLRR